MNYKAVLKSKRMRMVILHALEWIPDRIMIKLQYRIHTNKSLNLKTPRSFTEKIQWYKLYYRNPIMNVCVDKYAVKKYIAEKLQTEEYLIPTSGYWKNADDIDFDSLPDRCVLKTSNGSGTNIFFNRTDKPDPEKIRKQLNIWLRQVKKSAGREWAYDNVEPGIICEPVIKEINQAGKGLDDYKFFCFNSQVEMKWVDYDRFAAHKRVLFDRNDNRLEVACTYPNPVEFECPHKAFQVLQPIAEKIAEGFPHARVDLYYTDDKAYFGEITFYSGAGYELFSSDEYDLELGRKFILPPKMRRKQYVKSVSSI